MGLFNKQPIAEDKSDLILATERTILARLKARETEITEAALAFDRSDTAFHRIAAEAEGPSDSAYLNAKIAASKARERVEYLNAALEGDRKALEALRAKRLAAGKDAVVKRYRRLVEAREVAAERLAQTLKQYVADTLSLYIASAKLNVGSPLPLDAGCLIGSRQLHDLIQKEIARINPDQECKAGAFAPGTYSHPLVAIHQLQPMVKAIEDADRYLLAKLESIPDATFALREEKPSAMTATGAVEKQPESMKPETRTAYEILSSIPKQKLTV